MVHFYLFFGDEFIPDGSFELADSGGCECELELVLEGIVVLLVELYEVGFARFVVVHVDRLLRLRRIRYL